MTDETGSREDIAEANTKSLYSYVQEEWLNGTNFRSSIQDSVKKDEVIAKLTKMSNVWSDGNGPTESFDWDSIYGVCTNIMEDYSRKVDAVFLKIDQLNRQLAQWQESSFAVDAHRATKILNEDEKWIKLKEEFLDHKQKQLGTSANEIRESVRRLTKNQKMNGKGRFKILDELREKLVPKSSLETIVKNFKDELYERLKNSKDSMLPSKLNVQLLYENVDELLLPYNHNKILAIDFGGTNLRVAVIKTYPELVIEHMNSIRIENKVVNEKFFEDIVQSIFEHLHERFFEFFFDNDLVDNKLINIPVAITFSFPLDSECKIITMGKGFIMTEEIKNQSLVVLLQRILRDLCIKNNLDNSFMFTIRERIIINDSVAVHLMNTYVNQITRGKTATHSENPIAFILGTGLNASFEQPLGTLPKFKQEDILQTSPSPNFTPDSKIVMNSEIGFLGLYRDNIKLTEFDYVPPDASIIPMPLEYISGGRYLSMILYRILKHYGIYKELTELDDPEKFFNGVIFSKLLTLGTSYQTSAIHDSVGEIMDTLIAENQIFAADSITKADLEFLSDVAKIIILRASKYVAAVLVAINQFVNEMNGRLKDIKNGADSEKIDIGYVGSTLACTRYYQEQIIALAEGKIKLNFMQDSSLFGAAISTLL